MTKQKQNFANLLKSRYLNVKLTRVIRLGTLEPQVFSGLGIFCRSALRILSSSGKLDGDRWWTPIFRSLQRRLIGFKSSQGSGSLKDIPIVVPKPLRRCLGCVLRVVGLLEGEPSAQSEGPERSGPGFSVKGI